MEQATNSEGSTDKTAQPSETLKKVFLYGLTGVGKTVSLATLAHSGKNVRLLAAENNAVIGLQMGFDLHNISEEDQKRFSVMISKPVKTSKGASGLLTTAKDILTKDPKLLLKTADPKRKLYTRYISILQGLDDFVDAEGVSHGSIYDWGEDTIFCIDSMTVIVRLIRQTVVGGRAQLTMANWMPIQNMLLQLLDELTEVLQCHVVLLGHPVRTESEITQTESIYPSSPGQAIKDLILPLFTDAIYAERVQKNYYWHTQHPTAQCSARNMPSKNKLPPTFEHIKW